MTAPIGFTGSPLDRADAIRQDPDAFAAALRDPRALLLARDGIEPILNADGILAWAPLTDAPDNAPLALIGLDGGAPRFVALGPVPPGSSRTPALFAALDRMPGPQAAIYGAARSLLDWHMRHGFCANCGASTTVFRAGWGRQCGGCGAQHFPRVDPVVIMLAVYGDEALVARQPRFPAGRYSALAGFVEPGEAIEEAVRREIGEEAGLAVGAVRYVASQPWPFPSQLMIACIAEANDRTVTLDTNELEDAKWVSRAGIAAALAGSADAPFAAPPAYTIANSLFRAWLAERG